MERDEETGLGYHTARYYAPWLGRWCSADPAGLQGGINGFCYARNQPLGWIDRGGDIPRQRQLSWADRLTRLTGRLQRRRRAVETARRNLAQALEETHHSRGMRGQPNPDLVENVARRQRELARETRELYRDRAIQEMSRLSNEIRPEAYPGGSILELDDALEAARVELGAVQTQSGRVEAWHQEADRVRAQAGQQTSRDQSTQEALDQATNNSIESIERTQAAFRPILPPPVVGVVEEDEGGGTGSQQNETEAEAEAVRPPTPVQVRVDVPEAEEDDAQGRVRVRVDVEQDELEEEEAEEEEEEEERNGRRTTRRTQADTDFWVTVGGYAMLGVAVVLIFDPVPGDEAAAAAIGLGMLGIPLL